MNVVSAYHKCAYMCMTNDSRSTLSFHGLPVLCTVFLLPELVSPACFVHSFTG